jgi:hypothetical protein
MREKKRDMESIPSAINIIAGKRTKYKNDGNQSTIQTRLFDVLNISCLPEPSFLDSEVIMLKFKYSVRYKNPPR